MIKEDKRKFSPTEKTIIKRKLSLKKTYQNPELREISRLNAIKRWKNYSCNLTFTNKKTKEIITIKGSLKDFCIERNLSYKAFHTLSRGKVKFSQGWFLGTEEPKLISQKGEKRKPLSNEHKTKIAGGKYLDRKLVNINNETLIIKVNVKQQCKELNFDYTTLLSTLKGKCKSCNGWMLPETLESLKEKIEKNNFKPDIILTFPTNTNQILENTKCGIYIIQNKKNGNFYIGSSNNFTKRWWEHKKWLNLNKHQNKHLQNSWNKYGEKVFEFLIEKELCSSTTDDELKLEEQKYLDEFWDNHNICFNDARVADRPDTELNKKPIKQINKETEEVVKIWDSGASIERELGLRATCIYNACKGRLITFGGFKWKYANDELAKKYIEKTGKHGGHNKRKILLLNNETKQPIKQYSSLIEAERDLGISYTNILSVCAGRKTHIQGKLFCYEENYSNSIPDNTNNIKCIICNQWFNDNNLKSLSTHLQMFHKINTKEYTKNYLYNGNCPNCKVENCKNSVRYVSFTFKDYCKEHSFIAESKGGSLSKK